MNRPRTLQCETSIPAFQNLAMVIFQPAMPGSFSFDTILPPKVDTSVGAQSHIFQPPNSATSSLHGTASSLASSIPDLNDTKSRKRTRYDYSATEQATPYSARSHAWSCDLPSTCTTPSVESPPPLANARYRLAGGIDTPTAHAASAMDRSAFDPDSTELPAHSGRGFRDYANLQSDSYFPSTPLALKRERNGQSRMPKSPNIRDGFGNVIHRFAGVAGKVLENWTTAFRGFYAGGGDGYAMKPPDTNGFSNQWQGAGQDKFWSMGGEDFPPTPGGFPQDDYIPDYMSQDHSTPSRATKRSKRDSTAGDATASWVLVGSTNSSRETSPSRLLHRKIPGSSTRRTAPRLGRRPILPASRPSLSSLAGSPGRYVDRTSLASPRSPTTSLPKNDSPVSVEVQRHAARLRRKEAEEDANLKRFNQQLKAMIREGKEALGTKFEVSDEGVVEDGDMFGRGVG